MLKEITGVKTLAPSTPVTIIELSSLTPFYVEGYIDLSQMKETDEIQYVEEVYVATQLRTLNRQTVTKADLEEGEVLRFPSKLVKGYKLTLILTKGETLTAAYEFYQTEIPVTPQETPLTPILTHIFIATILLIIGSWATEYIGKVVKYA